ncbi:hypothetical protein EFK50_00510 [Nocardioides marmoriginsengisoli]|uniref:Dystroglycan-type cadherin-like domain-containing protein n=1 Tax=Nocardioides marmoriginsengisoli TaxID=661483 RepID=A0A3N0CRQ3_9ACTN|nr:putative Ig domain-containing protein [Nocardioides marmoriginsengisoli]RNL66147.1 hypothetical protein EFK50_00510 [Nocardioides marmoriginsengisoli]
MPSPQQAHRRPTWRRAAGRVGVAALGLLVCSPVLVSVAAPPSSHLVIGTPRADVLDRSAAKRWVDMRGLAGGDSLTGSRFADILRGGAGADRIIGGPGADVAIGGTGNDLFVLRPGDLRMVPGRSGRGIDRITDFAGAGTARGSQDRIVLHGFGRGARLVYAPANRGRAPRKQLYLVVDRSGVIRGRVSVTVKGKPVRRLNAADVVVRDVPPTNRPPAFGTGDRTGSVTQAVPAGGKRTSTGSIPFSDPDSGQAHTVAVAPRTNGAVGSLTAQISAGAAGWSYQVDNEAVRHLGSGATATEVFRLTLADSGAPARSTTADVTITQHGVNDAPVPSGALADQGAAARGTTTWALPAGTFTDPDDGDTVTLSATGPGGAALPSWLTFTPGTRTFSAQPKDGDVGDRAVVVTATDGHGGTTSSSFELTVTAAANEAPVLSGAGLTGSVTQVTATGQTRTDSGTVGFTDADTLQTHTVSVTPVGSPVGDLLAQVDTDVAGTGTIGWSYSVDNEELRHLGKDADATESFILTLSDGTTTAQKTVVVTQHGINDAPTSTYPIATKTTVAATTGTWTLPFDQFEDVDDGDVLTWSAVKAGTSALPTWLAYDAATRTFTATAAEEHEGTYSITVSAADTAGATASEAYDVEVVVVPAPVANDDTGTWTIPLVAPLGHTFSTNVLANDTDPGGETLTASGGGTWKLDGDPIVAGTFTVAADGTLTMDNGTDPLGPVQQLAEDEPWPATLTYTVSNGARSSTGTLRVKVIGGADNVVKLGDWSGPDNQVIDYNDPNPTVFDARGCFANPDGEFVQYSWSAQSTGTIPADTAFTSNTNVDSVSVLNNEWGFDSQASVTLTMLPSNGFPSQSRTINFVVTDSPSGPSGPTCGEQSHRPYAPLLFSLTDPQVVDLGGTSTGTGGNVLTRVIEPDGQAVVGGGYGYVGSPANPHGTWKVNPNGSVTVTENPANPLATGQVVDFYAKYRAIDTDGKFGIAQFYLKVVG